jgi:hypothetical protein
MACAIIPPLGGVGIGQMQVGASMFVLSFVTMTAVLGSGTAGTAMAAGAACVTAGDLAGGLRATFVSGRYADYRPDGEGMLRIVESPGKDGSSVSFLSQRGLYDVEMVALTDDKADPSTMVRTVYSVEPADLPVPSPGDVWVGQLTLMMPDGAATVANAAYQFGPAEPMQIGTCSYDTIDVKVSFMSADGWLWQEFTYFTDLGFGAIIARQAEGEEGPSRARVKTLEALTN